MNLESFKKHNYYAWQLVTDDFFQSQVNLDRITYDGWGYCLLEGNIRVDVWNPDYPATDIYKKEREDWNYVDIPFIDDILENLSVLLSISQCSHNFDNYIIAIDYVSKDNNIVIDKEKAIRYARSKSSFCDCELILNHS